MWIALDENSKIEDLYELAKQANELKARVYFWEDEVNKLVFYCYVIKESHTDIESLQKENMIDIFAHMQKSSKAAA